MQGKQCWKVHSLGYNAVANNMSLAAVGSQSAKFWENLRLKSSSRSSKVIDLGVNQKRICDFLLVITSSFVRISYRFRDSDV